MPNNEETEVEVPQEEKAFTELLQKFGIGTKALKAETIAENISRTGGEHVFEKPETLAERLATWHEYISPVKRKQVLEQWFAEKGIEVPEEAVRVAGVKSSEIKQREEEEKKKAEEEEKRKAKFFVDTETGLIRAAKEGERALTWDEAERVADRMKKERGKGEGAEKEPAFIQDAEGNWLLNPKARITGMELLAFDAIQRAHARGETKTPLEIMEEEAKRLQTIQAVFGGGKEGGGLTELAAILKTLKEVTGADEETKSLLAGIYKRLSEGEGGKGASEEVKALTDRIDKLTEELQKKELERRDEQIRGLVTEMSNLRTDFAKAVSESRAKDEYGIMSEGLKVIDRRLGAIEGIARARLGKQPALFSEGEKTELTEAISTEAIAEEELDKLAEQAFYQP